MDSENQRIVQCELLRHDNKRGFVGLLNWNLSRQIAQMEMASYSSSWSGLDCSSVSKRYYGGF
jgi:hypothetical protein